ncbi:hypothetical protein, partial [Burkholderia metallica]|uniref:hypothetical protein n=1 Tax=Burkholderia metallica TaxID=488729 RepID=UPI001ABB7344
DESVCYPVRRAIYAGARITRCSTASPTKMRTGSAATPVHVDNIIWKLYLSIPVVCPSCRFFDRSHGALCALPYSHKAVVFKAKQSSLYLS